jgi:hypothetical protein
VSKSCTIEYAFDAATMIYSGTIEAEMSEGLTEPGTETALDAKARFTVTGTPKP